MAEASADLALDIAGTGSLHDELAAADRAPRPHRPRRLLGLDERRRARAAYEAARAVLYTPYDEDYGYVTLQAFRGRQARRDRVRRRWGARVGRRTA